MYSAAIAREGLACPKSLSTWTVSICRIYVKNDTGEAAVSANKSGPETIVLKTNAYAVLAVSRNAETASAIKKLLQQSGESAFVATSAKQAWDEIRIGRV